MRLYNHEIFLHISPKVIGSKNRYSHHAPSVGISTFLLETVLPISWGARHL